MRGSSPAVYPNMGQGVGGTTEPDNRESSSFGAATFDARMIGSRIATAEIYITPKHVLQESSSLVSSEP